MENAVAARSQAMLTMSWCMTLSFPMESKQFESRSIIVEGKRLVSFEAGLGQAASYMGTCSA